ncbi:MAG: alpha/beta hydrolase [Gaiellaceae bacterium]
MTGPLAVVAAALVAAAAPAANPTPVSALALELPEMHHPHVRRIAELRLAPAAGQAGAKRRLPPLQLRRRCVTQTERKRIVRFEASDRTRLIGVLFGAGPKGVVLAHQGGGGAPGNLCAWVPYARILAGRGYRVLVFDHRGRGSSGSARTVPALQRVDLDVVAAVSVLRKRGVRSVVLGGASLGGTAVLVAGTRIRPFVQGVVSFSAPQQFVRVDAAREVPKLTVPVLYVAATGDEPFADEARALYEATASSDRQLAIFEGTAHGAPMLRDPGVRSLVDDWIASHSAL